MTTASGAKALDPGRPPPRRPTRSRPLGLAALMGLLASASLVAAGAAAAPSRVVPLSRGGFPDWLAGPLAGLGPVLSPVGFAVLMLVMFACYATALACADALPARLGIAFVVVVHLIFLVAPPLLQTDVFAYLAYARLEVLHDLSPYTHGAAAVGEEPALRYVGLKRMPSPYGPLFTLASYPLALLGLAGGLWAVKLAVAVASLGCVALVWACARRLRRAPLFSALFVGLNPLVLVWGVGAAHNDLFAVLLVLCGLLLGLAGREAAGAAAMVGAVAVKASAGLVLPFMVSGSKRRTRAVAGAAAAVAGVGALALAAFGADLLAFGDTLDRQGRFSSPNSVPTFVGRLLGFGGASLELRTAAAVAFAAVALLALVGVWRGADWVTAAGWATLALLLATAFLMPWYTALLWPLAALGQSGRLRLSALGLAAFMSATPALLLLSGVRVVGV